MRSKPRFENSNNITSDVVPIILSIVHAFWFDKGESMLSSCGKQEKLNKTKQSITVLKLLLLLHIYLSFISLTSLPHYWLLFLVCYFILFCEWICVLFCQWFFILNRREEWNGRHLQTFQYKLDLNFLPNIWHFKAQSMVVCHRPGEEYWINH